MGALPDLPSIRKHCEDHYHFRAGGFYIHPDDMDIRYRHASAHATGEVKDGHTHANPMRPFAESRPTNGTTDQVTLALDEGGHVIGVYAHRVDALNCLGFGSAEVAAQEGVQLQEWPLEKPEVMK